MQGEEGEGVMKGWGQRVRDKNKLIEWMTSDPQASVRGETPLQREEGTRISDWLASSVSLHSDWLRPPLDEGPF